MQKTPKFNLVPLATAVLVVALVLGVYGFIDLAFEIIASGKAWIGGR